jgi:formate dehydrogenase subunit delta
MSPDKLIYMANQIGAFFKSQGESRAPAGIADHINRFWEPRMRSAILAYWETGGEKLDPAVRDAMKAVKRPKTN